MSSARFRCITVETSVPSYWLSFHSSYQAIWIASSLGSFDAFASSSKPSSWRTRSRRSVNLTVRGSRIGKLLLQGNADVLGFRPLHGRTPSAFFSSSVRPDLPS